MRGNTSRGLTLAGMSEIRISKRWAPWWAAAIVGGIYLFFGYVVAQSLLHPETWGPGIRVFIPPFVVAGYLALAVVVNVRRIVVTPEGVRSTVGAVSHRQQQSVGPGCDLALLREEHRRAG